MHGLDDAWRLLDPPTDLGTQPSEVVAALTRHGAAAVTPKFFEDDLNACRLVRPFPTAVKRDSWYGLVCWSIARAARSCYIFGPSETGCGSRSRERGNFSA